MFTGTESVVCHADEIGYSPTKTLSSLNDSVSITQEMRNYVNLTWDEPYTSDNPHTLKYNVKIVHIETNATVKQLETDKTELIIPAKELQHCCSYSVSVGAKTENFTANLSYTIIPCSGCKKKCNHTMNICYNGCNISDLFLFTLLFSVPPALTTQSIRTNLSWTKGTGINVTFTIDGVSS